ncbi:MAG: hypothetical protein E6Q27_03000 [Aeromicrobium sp.]|nr:MAG: hypothetical protein E6Q27_03000 [Aeromicrobium sp.]
MRNSTALSALLASAFALGTLAACSTDKEPAAKPATATIEIREGTVSAQLKEKELTATELTKALPKDTVVTAGENSLIELSWSDGSITRLGSQGSMKVGEGKNRGQLLTGQSWHLVSTKGSGNYNLTLGDGSKVTTSGTNFITDCDAAGKDCNVFLLDGNLSAAGKKLTPKTWTTVKGGKAGAVNPLTWTDVASTEFAKKNSALDGDKGTSLEELYKDADPALASLTGNYKGKITATSADCLKGDCSPANLPKKGEVGDRTYSFEISCGKRLPCTGKSNTSWSELSTGKVKKSLVPLAFDGTTYSWTLKLSGPLCVWTDGKEEGKFSNPITWNAKPTKAAFVNGDFVVTQITGTATASSSVAKPVSSTECKPWEFAWKSDSTFTATRQAK